MWTEALSFANGAKGALAVGIPLLAVAMVIELAASAGVRRDGHYDRRDTVVNIVLSIGNVIVGKAWGPLAFAMYTLAYRFRVLELQAAGWTWLALFLADDLSYYWSHRAAHASRVLWASHVVHHSSPCFNLSVGARNSWTGGLTDWIFWMPLPLLGFPPAMMVTMQGLSLIWQFLIHTPYGGRLGLLGAVLNTPSHHRVHHGRNAQYLDRNFGGVLIVWDRLFGTFTAETDPVVYGTVVPPARPGNPLFIAFFGWAALLRRPSARARLPGS